MAQIIVELSLRVPQLYKRFLVDNNNSNEKLPMKQINGKKNKKTQKAKQEQLKQRKHTLQIH